MKVLVFFTLSLSLALNFYLYNRIGHFDKSIQALNFRSIPSNLDISEITTHVTDSVAVEVSSIRKTPTDSAQIPVDSIKDISSDLDAEFSKDYADNYTDSSDYVEITQEFAQASQNYIETKLKLQVDAYHSYQQVKQDFYKAQDIYYKQHPAPENVTPGEVYIPSRLDMLEQDKILSAHLDKLKVVMGNSGFNSYMQFVHRFNQEIVRRSPPNRPILIMDF
jgi:hypothetical protein